MVKYIKPEDGKNLWANCHVAYIMCDPMILEEIYPYFNNPKLFCTSKYILKNYMFQLINSC